MNTIKRYLEKIFRTWLTGTVILSTILFLYGCGNGPDKARSPETTERGKADFGVLVEETAKLLPGNVRQEKDRETVPVTVAEDIGAFPDKEVLESGLADLQINFYFPTPQEENDYLEILGKDICDPETLARRGKESEGLVSCATWKARLKKAKTLMKIDISKYESGGKAWEAIDRMRSTGGFIAGNVILRGDEEWPDTPEGQIEARSFIKSYYGRIRPTYVYGNDMGKPDDYLLENDRQLEMLRAGK